MDKNKSKKQEKTIAQLYLKDNEVKRKMSPEVLKQLENLPENVRTQLANSFEKGNLLFYSNIQKFFDNGIENLDTIITVVTHTGTTLSFVEQLLLARFLEYDYLPEEAKKEFMLFNFSEKKIDALTTIFSELKYENKTNPSPQYCSVEFPWDFRDI